MIFVFDLDGTIADATHRLHYVTTKPKQWGKFFAGIPDDPIYTVMADWIRSIPHPETVILQTGRPEQYRADTVAWLKRHNLNNSYDLLLMRDNSDRKSATLLKLEFLDFINSKYNNDQILWIEDTPETVQAINRQGVLALSAQHFLGV